MAIVKCVECNADVSSDAASCPQCGKPRRVNAAGAGIGAVVSFVILIGLAWWFLGGGMKGQVDSSMKDIQDKVAKDAVDQYNIAAAQGDKMQKCVQAGFVVAAYLQAKDDTNYNIWKATQSADCAAAGIPQ